MKNKITYILIITSLLICSQLFAQTTSTLEDVVYLKNGGVMRGTIVEQIPNKSLKIQTVDRNIFVYKFDEIERISKENIPIETPKNSQTINNYKSHGFINISEILYCQGFGLITYDGTQTYGNNTSHSFGFRTVNGIQINNHLSIGIGVGIDKYDIDTHIPITIDVRYSFINGKLSPTFNSNFGYSFGLDNAISGVEINPSIGIRSYISQKNAYFFNIGYKWSIQQYVPDSYQYTNESYSLYSGYISISTGFSF
jgi:hypothetical protein